MLLLHGFPQFWWAWRHQLPALAAHGWRAAAMDLRGYGGSDKTPRGYDPTTLATDISGVIRSLGARSAVVVGHGWGGYAGWATATIDPGAVRGLVSVAAPHPLHTGELASRAVLAKHLLSMQPPLLPERRIVADGAAWVEHHLRDWAAPGSGFPDSEAAERYRTAMTVWPSPHCAVEYHRWLFRSRARSDGRRFTAQMRRGVQGPVLQVLGELDPAVRLGPSDSSRTRVAGAYAAVAIAGCGHFPHEEAPASFNAVLLDWLDHHG
ncbi:MAG TPA: alpha/beta hydrolase [Nocardioidaceae bacterium]|nr:alpha/beta hydrolase [Nocardioidaceae bacterium]